MNPAQPNDKNRIILGDCLEVMRGIPDNSVDLILTDPPYELDNHGGGTTDFAQRKLVKDLHIDFISNSFDLDTVFSEFIRLCNTVNVVVFCSNKQVSKIMNWWETLGYSVTLLAWDKPNPVPFGNGKYISNLEFMVYVRGKNAAFNGSNLKTFRNVGVSSSKRLHPTEKPLELVKRLIEIHSNENDLVLDPFAGSGSTLIACKDLNRNYIGIEINPEYVEVAEERLKQGVLL